MTAPTRLGGSLATAAVVVGGLVLSAGAGVPGGFLVGAAGALVVAVGAAGVASDDRRRAAAGSLATVAGPGVVAAGAALSGGDWPLVLPLLLAVLAAGLDAVGEFESGGFPRQLLLLALGGLALVFYGAMAVAGGVLSALVTAAGAGLDVVVLLSSLFPLWYLASFGLELLLAALLVRSAARLTPAWLPASVAKGSPTTWRDRLAAVEGAVDARVGLIARAVVGAYVVAIVVTPVVAGLGPSVGVPRSVAFTSPAFGLPHRVGWTAVAVLLGVVALLRGGLALGRRSGQHVADRLALGTGPVAVVALASVLGPVGVLGGLLPAGLPSVLGTAGGIVLGTGLLLFWTFAAVVIPWLLAAKAIGPSRASGVALGAAVLVVAALSADGLAAVVAVVAALLSWDVGENAATLASHVGPRGPATRAELVHAGAGTGAGLAAVGVAALTLALEPLGRALLRSGYAVAAALSLLLAGLVLVALLRG